MTGAALALLQDKEERAYFVAAAEKYYVYGMKGYSDDGYCSEGVGYYNYGFARLSCCVKKFVVLRKGRLISSVLLSLPVLHNMERRFRS